MLALKDSALLKEQCLVGGDWIAAAGRDVLEVRNPADGEVVGVVPSLGIAETRQAIGAAQAGFEHWRDLPAIERSQRLRAWNAAVLSAEDDLAALITAEQGKPLAEALSEVRYAAAYIEWFASEARRIYGEVVPGPAEGRRVFVLQAPVGVCAAITPWNFPAAMVTRKVAPALAAGCSIIVKPSEETPLTALALAELAQRAGIPAGVINVVTGDPAVIGGALTESPVVRKLSFTGSTKVGRLLMAQCASTVKRLSLELGGNAPFVVFDDSNLEEAVRGAIACKFRNAGQTCVSANRLLVQRGVYSEFSQRLAEAAADLKVGRGDQPMSKVGPLINIAARDKVRHLVSDAIERGAHALLATPADQQALFVSPMVLTGVTPDMAIARQEIFGPVAALLPFETEEEAVAMANDSEHGLAAYLYTSASARIWRVAPQLEYGMVGINTGVISNEAAPFGGVKQSGFGREGSRWGVQDYLFPQYLALS